MSGVIATSLKAAECPLTWVWRWKHNWTQRSLTLHQPTVAMEEPFNTAENPSFAFSCSVFTGKYLHPHRHLHSSLVAYNRSLHLKHLRPVVTCRSGCQLHFRYISKLIWNGFIVELLWMSAPSELLVRCQITIVFSHFFPPDVGLGGGAVYDYFGNFPKKIENLASAPASSCDRPAVMWEMSQGLNISIWLSLFLFPGNNYISHFSCEQLNATLWKPSRGDFLETRNVSDLIKMLFKLYNSRFCIVLT